VALLEAYRPVTRIRASSWARTTLTRQESTYRPPKKHEHELAPPVELFRSKVSSRQLLGSFIYTAVGAVSKQIGRPRSNLSCTLNVNYLQTPLKDKGGTAESNFPKCLQHQTPPRPVQSSLPRLHRRLLWISARHSISGSLSHDDKFAGGRPQFLSPLTPDRARQLVSNRDRIPRA
jgi:hypothetical protein